MARWQGQGPVPYQGLIHKAASIRPIGATTLLLDDDRRADRHGEARLRPRVSIWLFAKSLNSQQSTRCTGTWSPREAFGARTHLETTRVVFLLDSRRRCVSNQAGLPSAQQCATGTANPNKLQYNIRSNFSLDMQNPCASVLSSTFCCSEKKVIQVK